jgi:hypothetical protein
MSSRFEGGGSLSGRTRTFAVAAMLAPVAVGFGLIGAASAHGDDVPPTTVPSATVPAPDPAPPKPKPVRAPAAPRAAARSAPASTYRAPRATAVAPRSTTGARPSTHITAKPRPKQVKNTTPAKQRSALLPTFSLAPPVAAVRVRSAFPTPAGGGADVGSLLIVLGLGLAIAFLAVAVVPATSLKWRPAAIFVYERQVGLTLAGLTLLVVAAATIFWTNGP